MQVLLIDPPGNSLPEGTSALLSDIGWHIEAVGDYRAALARAQSAPIDAAIFAQPAETERCEFQELLRLLDARRVAAIMITDGASAARPPAPTGALLDVVDRQISLAELRGRLTMIERYHGLLRRMEQEIRTMERLGQRLHHHFHEVEQELRLASRLQRDFLPDLRQPLGDLRMAALFRPASWVSGDMYDVFRVDNEHTGLYIADAVGHGMAASLLTMFIKRAIVPTKAAGDRHVVIPPGEVLLALNDALADQSLPNCQFVTAFYALFHHPTGTLRFARGGHPCPIVFSADGDAGELNAIGGLLGIAKGEEFAEGQTVLRPGDKMLFYTDGVELAFESGPAGESNYKGVFESVRALPIEAMIRRLETLLDADPGSVAPRDDITILGMEVGSPSSATPPA